MTDSTLYLQVWGSPEWQSWGVTEYRGEDPQDTESDWYHLKADAVSRAEERLYNPDDEVEKIEVFTKTNRHQSTTAILKGSS